MNLVIMVILSSFVIFLLLMIYMATGELIVGQFGWDKNNLTILGKLIYWFFLPSKKTDCIIDFVSKYFCKLFFKEVD